MNILFIGPYRQNDGWGIAARDYARALATTDHNLTIRPIYMSNHIDNNIPKDLLGLEQNDYKSYDVVIQKVLPHLFHFDYNYKIIGLFTTETGQLQHTPWIRYINLLNMAMVPSGVEINNLRDSGVNIPICPISEPIDITKYNKVYPRLDIIKDTFNFYFIGEHTDRKNIKALIIAFHLAFQKNEPVNLVLKVNSSKRQQLEKDIEEIKRTLRLYYTLNMYKKEIIIAEHLPEEILYGLHQSCHCLVMPSRGEAFCRPVVDAMGFGNPSIITNGTGMTDYIDNGIGYLTDSITAPVYTSEPPLPFLYTGRETWEDIDILSLAEDMRHIYDNPKIRKEMSQKCKERVNQFSYDHIGQRINSALESL